MKAAEITSSLPVALQVFPRYHLLDPLHQSSSRRRWPHPHLEDRHRAQEECFPASLPPVGEAGSFLRQAEVTQPSMCLHRSSTLLIIRGCFRKCSRCVRKFLDAPSIGLVLEPTTTWVSLGFPTKSVWYQSKKDSQISCYFCISTHTKEHQHCLCLELDVSC